MDGGRGDWGRGGGDETLEELDFIESSFCVSGCGFDDFESDVSVQPGGTESVCGVKRTGLTKDRLDILC